MLQKDINLITSPAVLIQDIREFVAFIRPILNVGLDFNEIRFLEWLVAKELKFIYCLFDNNKLQDKNPEYLELYNKLNSNLEAPLSVVFSYYIKAPKIYPDYNEVKVKIVGACLYIDYFAVIPRLTFPRKQ